MKELVAMGLIVGGYFAGAAFVNRPEPSTPETGARWADLACGAFMDYNTDLVEGRVASIEEGVQRLSGAANLARLAETANPTFATLRIDLEAISEAVSELRIDRGAILRALETCQANDSEPNLPRARFS